MSVIDRDFDNARLTGFVRQVPQRTGAILNVFLPDRNRQTRTFRVRTITKSSGMAPYRTLDTPSPVVGRPGFTERTGSLPPISESMVLGEEETLGLYERIIAGAYDEEVMEHVYNDAATLADRIYNRVEAARAEALAYGEFRLTDTRDGLVDVVSFDRPSANALNAAASHAVSGTSILTDLRTMNEASLDDHGQPLRYVIASSAWMQNAVTNTEIRTMLGSGTGVTPGLVTPSAVSALLRSLDLPEPVRYDFKVDGTALIDPTLLIGLPEVGPELGETQWGVTAESLEIQLAREVRPGLTATMNVQSNPVQKLTDVTGLVMPVPGDASRVYTMDTQP